jgi:hypothetical protein
MRGIYSYGLILEKICHIENDVISNPKAYIRGDKYKG